MRDRAAGPEPEVAVEATYGWYWAVDVLQACGARVHLAHPLGLIGWAHRRVKNDRVDAADLADLLRLGCLFEAWIAPPAVRELRELVRYRAKLVALRSGLKAQVHAVLAKEGVAVPLLAEHIAHPRSTSRSTRCAKRSPRGCAASPATRPSRRSAAWVPRSRRSSSPRSAT